MERVIQTILFEILLVIFSLSIVKADVTIGPVGPGTYAIPIVFLGIVIVVIALISWLIIRKIKKKNASKFNK
ncbi:MAG: hypothetical protein AABW91_00620 [Nanoarchaeota archaeon]